MVCPDCHCSLRCHDHRERYVTMKCGKRLQLSVPRGICPSCGRLHTVLPNFVVPYKHYGTTVIQGVVDGKDLDTCLAEDSTMQRWRREFRQMEPHIESLLRRIQEKAYPLFGASLLAFLRRTRPESWAASVLPLLSVHHFFFSTQFACCPDG